eukprot:jgi/Undpi1/5845/HiC_scaffold_2.g01119.m1
MSASPGGKPDVGVFVPERFCDEVYDYVDDNLAEAMDDMEKELREAARKVGAGAVSGATTDSIGTTVKTCCDNVQKRLQKEFDRNLDIFDRYVKKNVSAAKTMAAASSSPRGAAAAGDGGGHTGGASSGGKAGAGAGAGAGQVATTPTDGVAGKDRLTSSETGAEGQDAWILEVSEETPPKRLEEEEELDAEIQHLRKRRRQSLRRYAAMVRKGAREAAVLQDVDEYVEALQVGVSSSFDYNGLTPVPAKVQEAVQSCAELRATAARAQDLTRRVERLVQGSAKNGSSLGGGSSGGSGAVVAPPAPRDLQAMFQRSSERQVVAGGAADYSALETRLKR